MIWRPATSYFDSGWNAFVEHVGEDMIERVIRGSPSRIYRDMLVKAFKESQSHEKALEDWLLTVGTRKHRLSLLLPNILCSVCCP
jgi:hypothetical protein